MSVQPSSWLGPNSNFFSISGLRLVSCCFGNFFINIRDTINAKIFFDEPFQVIVAAGLSKSLRVYHLNYWGVLTTLQNLFSDC